MIIYILIVVAIILFLAVYFISQDSKKETKKERYAEAAGYIVQSTADKIAGLVHDIAEPADKKKIRQAREVLAIRNGDLYNFRFYSDKVYLEKLFTIDDSFKEALDTLGLSVERWEKIGHHLFYVGAISTLYRNSIVCSKKNSESVRQNIIDTWGDDSLLKYDVETLKEALSYFHIDEKEWIKYGDAVIEMYNLNDDKDIEEYGIIPNYYSS